jgi:c-di-AMP phosphodiesterase-like protein
MRYILSRILYINIILFVILVIFNKKIALLFILFIIMTYKFYKNPQTKFYKSIVNLRSKRKRNRVKIEIAHNNYIKQLNKCKDTPFPKPTFIDNYFNNKDIL